ncbi:bis(5'-nucleosyl)-tetraphosphatase [Caldiplasma sukawensis]
MKEEKSCGIIIFRRRGEKIEYLILEKVNMEYDFPKGHVENGEEDLETAKREVEEETGIKNMSIIEGFKEIIDYKFNTENGMVHKTVVMFLAEADQRVTISGEHRNFKWLDKDSAINMFKFSQQKYLIERASEFLEKYYKNKK